MNRSDNKRDMTNVNDSRGHAILLATIEQEQQQEREVELDRKLQQLDGDENSKDDADDDAVDEEGLRTSYDVILCGTGLVQSILASALSRANQRVLHVDGADQYGGLETTYTLAQLRLQYQSRRHDKGENADITDAAVIKSQDLAATEEDNDDDDDSTNPHFLPLHEKGDVHSWQIHEMHRPVWPISIRSAVTTPYGTGRVVAITAPHTTSLNSNSNNEEREEEQQHRYTLQIQLVAWRLADGSCPHVYVGIPAEFVTVTSSNETDQSLSSSSSLLLSIDPEYLWTTSKIRTVTAETAARVLDQHARYLALDATPYLLYATGPAVEGLLVSAVSEYMEFKSTEGLYYYSRSQDSENNNKRVLSRVPCSKNDVFGSRLLRPMDKRRLMKFLQTALDYGTAEALREESERQQLQHGMTAEELKSWNERHLNQGRSLARPQNKAVASSDLEQLQNLCREGSSTVSFESYLRDTQKLSTTLTALVRYAMALETEEVLVSVSTGMKQLCSHVLALGRFGTTAFLTPLYGSGELSQAFCRSAAVHGATYLLRRAPIGIAPSTGDYAAAPLEQHSVRLKNPVDNTTKDIKCRHVVIPDAAIVRGERSDRRVLRRISILAGKPLRTEDFQPQQQRHVIIIPPRTLGDNQDSTIHGLLLDEAVNVAPHVPGGCSVLHLTTTVTTSGSTDTGSETVRDCVLDTAARDILGCCQTDDSDRVEEIFHVSFSYDVSPEIPPTATWSAHHHTSKTRVGCRLCV
jgi:Rab proteins geranylgeranyltransferase component A